MKLQKYHSDNEKVTSNLGLVVRFFWVPRFYSPQFRLNNKSDTNMVGQRTSFYSAVRYSHYYTGSPLSANEYSVNSVEQRVKSQGHHSYCS